MVNRQKTQKSRRRSVRKSRFKYRPPTSRKIKERSEQTGGGFDAPWQSGIDVFRPKQGDNIIRILPATWDEPEYYGYDVWVHPYVGVDEQTYVCPRKMFNDPCPICDAAEEAKREGDDDTYSDLKAKQQVWVYVIDRDERDPKPMLWPMSWSMDREISTLCINRKTGKSDLIDHPDDGYDISFTRRGQGLNTRYVGLQIDRDPTPIDDDPQTHDDILEQIQDKPIPTILKVKDADFLERVIDGTAEEQDPDLDEDGDDDPPRRKRSKRKMARKPNTRSRRRRDEEEEEEPRRKKSARGKKKREEPEPDLTAEDIDEMDFEELCETAEDLDLDVEIPEEETRKATARLREDIIEALFPEDQETEEEEEEEPEPPRRKRGRGKTSSRRRARDEDEEEEEEEPDEGEEEEEDEEEPPRRSRRGRSKTRAKSSRRRSRDEDEEEEEEPPRRKRGRGRRR